MTLEELATAANVPMAVLDKLATEGFSDVKTIAAGAKRRRLESAMVKAGVADGHAIKLLEFFNAP